MTARNGPERPRRALILVENLSVPFDRRVWRECRALRAAGWQVSVICPRGQQQDAAPHEVIEGVSIHRYRAWESTGSAVSYLLEYGVAMLQMARLSFRVWRREGFDAIQLCNPPDTLILVALPYKLLRKKILFDQHDLAPDLYLDQKGQSASGGFFHRALLFFERLTYRFSDVIFTVNDACRAVVLERGGADPERVFVVRNGPDKAGLRLGAPNPALAKGKAHLLAYVGMMGPQDGVDILLRVIARLGREDIHVRIIGGGTHLDTLKRMAEELKVSEQVEFTGRISHAQVLDEIASATLCLCPDPKTPMNDKASLIKVLEYMAQAKPIAAFELDEVRRMAGEAAWYAPGNDEAAYCDIVRRLLEDPDARQRMGAIGRERVLAEFTWDHAVEHLHAAYAKAFEG